MPENELAIGVDLGGTKIAAALVNRNGEVLAKVRRPTQVEAGDTAVLDAIAACIDDLLAQAPDPVLGIGVGSPGQVDPQHGIVRHALNLGWDEVSLLSGLTMRLDTNLPLYVQRDSFAELLGEAYFGAGLGCTHLVYLGLGTGLGGAALSNGRLLTGVDYMASEIGHLVLDPAARPWHGDLHGSAESVVSGSGVLAETRMALQAGRHASVLTDSPALTTEDVVMAAYEGDELATAVFAKVANWLTRILAIYAVVLNPQRIIIGGGLGRAAFDLLLPLAHDNLSQWALKQTWQNMRVVRSQLMSSAVGASCLVWHHQDHKHHQTAPLTSHPTRNPEGGDVNSNLTYSNHT